MKGVHLSDIMCSHPITITADVRTGTVVHLLLRYRINGILVVEKVNKENILGIFNTSDALNLLENAFIDKKDFESELNRISQIPVGQLATKNIISLQINTSITEAIDIMHKKKVHTLPVYDGQKLVGVVGKHDLLNIAFSE